MSTVRAAVIVFTDDAEMCLRSALRAAGAGDMDGARDWFLRAAGNGEIEILSSGPIKS